MIGPSNPFSQELHGSKYRAEGETFDDYCVRYSRTTADDEDHFRHLLDATRNQRILPAGRQQLAVGRPFKITAHNCYTGETIDDSMRGIMQAVTNGALTLRTGGGDGWDFSTLRPKGDPIRGLGLRAYASGPISFMHVWNAMCGTVMSAGERRGAMMGILRVDHPDILEFIHVKQDQKTLKNFNISVAVTHEFMEALACDGLYELRFNGIVYGFARAVDVWSQIMEMNWDWAEPGVIFIDTMNDWNNLWYCETFAATNPCSEQPLPPHGACLLGSLNMVKYLVPKELARGIVYEMDLDLFDRDVRAAVKAFDNVIDRTSFPLPEQAEQQRLKRRMGVGVTGMANALEIMGYRYGSAAYIETQSFFLERLRDIAYRQSIVSAATKGAFPAFDEEKYLSGKFIKTLPDDIQWGIKCYGVRNSHLTSIAPTGTISMCADNVSSGIEPPYSLTGKRLVIMPEGKREIDFSDYAFANHGVRGKTAMEVTAEDHIKVLCAAQKYVDSSVSKTCNVLGQKKGQPGGVSFSDFKKLYTMAYEGGAKGCSTFNANGKRAGIITADNNPEETEGAACFVDPSTGVRSCE